MLLTVLRNDSNEINNPRDREIERVITHDGDGMMIYKGKQTV